MTSDPFLHLEAVAKLHPGMTRENNEDSILLYPGRGCFAVADGMGGGACGEIASKIVIESVHRRIRQSGWSPSMRECAVIQSAYGANSYIGSVIARRELKSMGSTLVCLLFDSWNYAAAAVFHAGDSRCYRFRRKRLECLTRDHSLANAKEKGARGIRPGILTNAVGATGGFFLERTAVEVKRDDLFLLCSDGLSGMLPEKVIAGELAAHPSPETAAEALLALALDRGGRDNISLILVRVASIPPRYTPTAEELLADGACQEQSIRDLTDTEITQ